MSLATDLFQSVVSALQRYFLLRWTLANIVGWSTGLYVGSLALMVIGGLPGLLMAGLLTGLIAGGAQVAVLRDSATGSPRYLFRRWIIFSTIGGMCAAIPVFISGFTLVAGRGIGFALMGAVFGSCFGWVQALALRHQPDFTLVWVLANVFSGSLCALFSFSGFPVMLPIFCTLGPVLFGVVTGYTLLQWAQMEPPEDQTHREAIIEPGE